MTSQGPNFPVTGANNTSRAGTLVNWSNSTNIVSSNDSRATATNNGSNGSEFLVATNLGFSIPSGATIGGIVAGIERVRNNDSGSPTIFDALLYLVRGSTIQTGETNKADVATNWPIIDTRVTYGSTSDLWGGAFASSDINSSGFGVALAVDLTDGATTNIEARVDAIDLTVHYTPAAGNIPEKMHHRKILGIS